MAHAEASAKTVDAAVTAAAAQLGLRSDQVDVEVLEEPVSSTFGYIGSPARVRVTPRTTPSSIAAVPDGSAGGGSGPVGAGAGLQPGGPPSAQEPSTDVSVSNDAVASSTPSSERATPPVPDQHPATATATETGNGQVLADHSTPTRDQRAVQVQESPPAPQRAGSSETVRESAAGLVPSGSSAAADASATLSGPATSAAPERPAPSPPGTPPAAVPEAAASPSSLPTHEVANDGPSATATEDAPREEARSSARETRPPRRTYKDEPIEPQMVEEDTERAGDFLEGLLDALDVDGDITTWIDEVGGHIDLEGTELDGLVGPNGETLDALQELTRLAVLRKSKRRVRLLIDINGFRARQREQLTSMVRATVDQVIRTREDHELQPMTPAERKIVHDAVAAIEGARTESLGEEPNRRVVIRAE